MGGYQGSHEEIPPFPSTATVRRPPARRRRDVQRRRRADPHLRSADHDVQRAGGLHETQFENNRIPGEPDQPGVGGARRADHRIPWGRSRATTTTLRRRISATYRYNSYLTRIDHQFSPRQRMSFSNSANWGSEKRSENSLPPPALRSDNWPTHRNHYLATGDHTLTVGPKSVLNTRVSFDEPHPKEFGPLGSVTLPLRPFQRTEEPWFPNMANYANMFAQGFADAQRHSGAARLSRTAGTHLLKAGAYRLTRMIRKNVGNQNGTYAFNDNFTRRNALTGDGSGNSFASFLLGYPSSGSVDINGESDQRYPNYNVFVPAGSWNGFGATGS